MGQNFQIDRPIDREGFVKCSLRRFEAKAALEVNSTTSAIYGTPDRPDMEAERIGFLFIS